MKRKKKSKKAKIPIRFSKVCRKDWWYLVGPSQIIANGPEGTIIQPRQIIIYENLHPKKN